MPHIGVLIVHGMGTATEDFWRPLARVLDDRLDHLGIARGSVAWQSGRWAQHLDMSEEVVWALEQEGGKMDFKDLRRFVLTALGDAVAYRRVDNGGENVYMRVHETILAHLRALRATLGADKPLVVVAHSLGSVIMSDFIWNAQHPNEFTLAREPFESMQTLAGLVTFGSTLPLFSLAVDPIEAIAFPPPELPEPLRSAAKWYNYYDRDDILGWPLKTLSPSYAAAVTADREIDVGNWKSSWNPMAHTQYWTDKDFVHPVAAQLADVIRAARGVVDAGPGLIV